MPAKSKSQFKFIKAVEEGAIKKLGLSPEKAHEYTAKNKSFKHLPEHVSKFNKINKLVGK